MSIRPATVRLGVVLLLFAGLFAMLGVRARHLQLGDHSDLRAAYRRNVVFSTQLQGSRGRILDRNGRVLAQDEVRKNVAIDPQFIHQHNNPELVTAALSRFLHVEPAVIGTRMAETRRRFSYLEKYVEDNRALELQSYLSENALRRGVVFEKVNTRTYPHQNLLSHVLGFENREGVGSAGVELEMNRFLTAKGGLRVGEKDGHRREMVNRRHVQIDPQDGADVVLTVDQYLQYGVEEALEKALSVYNAKAAWAVVMDSRTGAILAMAGKPDYDLNEFYRADPYVIRNQNLGAVYEPGSIMKPMVFAAALNEGLLDPDEEIHCENGTWMHRNRPLRDFYPYGILSAREVLQKSSNIGSAKIALRMNPETFHSYVRAFGFGSRTGIDLPGEEFGIVHPPRNWDSLTHSRMSMGHAVSVTAMQMAVAMNVIANDGRRIQPYIISQVRSAEGELLYQRRPEPAGEQVIRPEVAREMREMLAMATDEGGTGRRARFGDFRVAGKTGTAEKVQPGGGYGHRINIASFVGFFPAENPAVTILVSVDEPTGDLRTGGSVAAPVFADIGRYVAGYMAIPLEGF